MLQPSPDPLALFSLYPYPGNERAERVVSHPCNSHLVSRSPDSGVLALGVILNVIRKSPRTLVTLRRGVNADIYVEGSSISRIQCSFEIDLEYGVVMFCDRSFSGSSQVFGENSAPFEYNWPRKVLVQKGFNTIIGIGGGRRDLIQFKLEWHQDLTRTIEIIKSYKAFPRGLIENPRLSLTADHTPTGSPSWRESRHHTPGYSPLKIRYITIGKELRTRQFGTIYKAIDVDPGKFIAVKIVEQPTTKSKQQEWMMSIYYSLKREVEALYEISHPHIVDYIASQGWGGPKVEIFMGLKEGTLESLIESGADEIATANAVFPQMLQALDCIAWKGIIHRDVKPVNILYTPQPGGQYQFQLGDFGLCGRAGDATTVVGSRLYMAPELFQNGSQTTKIDVWSLLITMLWRLNIEGFRQGSHQFNSTEEFQDAVTIAASRGEMFKIKEMAIVNPELRASAAQMLVKCFIGIGLSTPPDQVPALSSTIAPARSLATASPSVTPRISRIRRRAKKTASVFSAITRSGITTLRGKIQPPTGCAPW